MFITKDFGGRDQNLDGEMFHLLLEYLTTYRLYNIC
jgi:hypothetical protein